MLFEPSAILTGVTLISSDFKKSKSIRVPGRPFHSLSYRLSGTVSIGWQEQTLISGPGSLTFLPQGFSYNTSILEPLGLEGINWYQEKKYWPFLMVFFATWKSVGYNMIIYS